MRKRAACVLAVLVGACGGAAPPPPGGPLSRPILGLTAAAVSANAANLPAGFPGAQETACAADTTRSFIGEIADHGISDVQVSYEWAPVVAGPIANRPTVAQPELYVAGEITHFALSTLDIAATHPYGYDANFDLRPDSDFAFLVHNRAGDTDGTLHAEIEEGLYPATDFGMTPTAGDRVLMKGAWIFDCGHPPYETEMHPPTFLALARAQDPRTTVSLAFVNPIRVAQLYHPNTALAADFANTARFTDPEAKPFVAHFLEEILAVANGQSDRIQAHVLLEATRFDTLTWSVCAPSPRPNNATLKASYRFATRTGVKVAAATDDASGCVQLTATMDSTYTPMAQNRMDKPWSWAQISADASAETGMTLDIRQKVIDVFHSLGFNGDYVALHQDQSPYIDGYAPLRPHADAALDSPTAITQSADDQPFPFYGRVWVTWGAS
jgi:hypothetical protein